MAPAAFGNSRVGEYNATTGAAVNAGFIMGLSGPAGMAVDGSNHLFVANSNSTTVGSTTPPPASRSTPASSRD